MGEASTAGACHRRPGPVEESRNLVAMVGGGKIHVKAGLGAVVKAADSIPGIGYKPQYSVAL